jgi:hypothetical protein
VPATDDPFQFGDAGMWNFIFPHADGTVFHVMIGGKTVEVAFQEFRRNWWTVEMTRAVGVWRNAALTHRVLPIYDEGKDEMDCFLQELKP